MKTMHLFAGLGGGLYADLILGHTPIVAVEWDPYCCQVLRERAAEGWFPGLHVHEGDVRLFDPSPWKGRVDILHAGFPCPTFSVAGKRAGTGDTRGQLYLEVIRHLRVLRPGRALLENVPGILSANGGAAFGAIQSDLAQIGYSCKWLCLSAADVGANHKRERWWGLCTNTDGEHGDDTRLGAGEIFRERPETASLSVRDAFSGGLHRIDRGGAGAELTNGCSDVSNVFGERCEKQRLSFTRAQEDGPDVEFCGWWGSEPLVGRVANGVSARRERIRGLGNAQVPLQAALAWALLTDIDEVVNK